MKIPSRLVIQDQKITNYLLVFQPRDDKSEYLAAYGYTIENWQRLKSDILEAVQEADITEITLTSWGNRYKVKCEWYSPNNRLLKVVTIWQEDRVTDEIRFVTLFPDKDKED